MDPKRPHDHIGMEVISAAECDDLLSSAPIGRIAYLSDGEPVILPVNYGWHQGSVVFRSAIGSKLDAAIRHVPMAFEIDSWEPGHHRGWSVLVRGTATEVVESSEVEELEKLGLVSWVGELDRWIRIRPDEITGRRID